MLQIAEWASKEICKLAGDEDAEIDDIWAAMQFDSAVSYFGVWVENRLNRFDKQGKPVYSLDSLLTDTPTTGGGKITAMKGMLGAKRGKDLNWGRKKKNKRNQVA